MLFLRQIVRRIRGRGHRLANSPLEQLEPRQMLSAGPALTGVKFLGPYAGAITGIVLSFNEELDPTTAQQVNAYKFGRPNFPSSNNNGVTFGDILPFLGRPKLRVVKGGKIQWVTAAYDGNANTVTLTPYQPFRAQTFLRVLRVKGSGPYALKDVTGVPLGGGTDTVIRWVYHSGKQVHYTDIDGDIVTITLHGRGTLFSFVRNTGDPLPVLFVQNVNPASSVLTGVVRRRPHGNGVADVGQIAGAHLLVDNVLNNPQFSVQAIT